MAERMTVEQRSSVQAAILIGHELADFAARHPEYPQEDLRQFWVALATEMKTTRLKPGQYWGIPAD